MANNKLDNLSENSSLKSIFEEALSNFEEIDSGKTAATEQQTLIKTTIEKLETATRLINIGQVFSSNEMLEEVSTGNIQYLAIPALLGKLVTQLQNTDRLSILETAEVYFKDFLTRCQEYSLISKSINVEDLTKISDKKDLTNMVLDRNEKIKRYEKQKKLHSELVNLKEILDRSDEEVRRKYFVTFVKNLVFTAEEELKSIAMEKPFAEIMKSEREKGVKTKGQVPKKVQPLQAVIITRNELQKKVYGAGYPSLPTMTVDEFYSDRVKQGIFPEHGSSYAKSMQEMADPQVEKRMEEEEETKKDEAEDTDDPEALQRKRNMDEYKDEHRRGWGNRMNRS